MNRILLLLLTGILLQTELKSQNFDAEREVEDDSLYSVTLNDKTTLWHLTKQGYRIVKRVDFNKYILEPNNNTLNHHLGEYRSLQTRDWKLGNIDFNELKEGVWLYADNKVGLKKLLSGYTNLSIRAEYGSNMLIEGITSDLLIHLLHTKSVLYVGNESNSLAGESRVIDLNLVPNHINYIQHSFPTIRGEEVTVSVKENAFEISDVDLKGRGEFGLTASAQIANHATEMATIIGGAGNSFITGLGVAPGVSFISSGFNNLLPETDDEYRGSEISIQNHSYGTQIENFYGSLANAYDVSTINNPYLLHVFSVGNEGQSFDTVGRYAGLEGFATLTGNFKQSKNTLSIGAVDTTGMPLTFSSSGPAYDGRIKPELVAYSMVGSSNSAALVSGTSVLLQDLHKSKYGVPGHSALIKALLINGADDVFTIGPDFKTGFGNLNASRSVELLESGNFFMDSIGMDEESFFDIEVSENAQLLKVTLVWNDPAAIPNSEIALINDLDLTIQVPSGNVLLPWVLDPTPSVENLAMISKRKRDSLNNVEQISINQLEPGNYRISIKGHDISQEKQEFYIVYDIEYSEEFRWTFPTKSDNIPYNGETVGYLRWESSLVQSRGDLIVSNEGTQGWLNIANDVDLEKGYFRWSAGGIVDGIAQIGMVVDSDTFRTDPFVISRPTKVNLGFDCGDSILINWESFTSADHYKLQTVGDRYLTNFTTTQDTFSIIDKNSINDNLIRVVPVLENGYEAIGSLTFNYLTQGTGCYFSSLFAEVEQDSGIYVSVFLGTTFGISNVILERLENSSIEPVANYRNPDSASFRLLDKSPNEGYNEYRVRMVLDNAKEVISDTVSSYYLADNPFLLFPNPLDMNTTNSLNVFSRVFEDQKIRFLLFDSQGSRIQETELQSDRESITIPNYRPGIYFYWISVGKKTYSGKLIFK